MYCRNCGTKLQEGQKFCPKCGTPVPGTTETAESGTPSEIDEVNGTSVGQQGGKENINTKMIIAIAAAVVVIAVVVIAVVVTRSDGSAGQAEEEPEAVREEAESAGEEKKEPELTEEEKGELKSQELADNIVLDLTISEGYAHKTISDSVRDNTLDLILVSGTITNNNDENCKFDLQYDMEVTTLDNYGDEQTESDDHHYSDWIYIAAHDTIPFNEYICSVHGGYRVNGTFDERHADEDTTYACKGVTIDKGGTEVVDMPTGGMLPVSAVSAIQLSFDDERDDAIVTFTVPNDTDDRWKEVEIGYDIFLEGEYITSDTCSADYIKPGENAEASETFYDASNWGFTSSYSEGDKYDGDSFNNAVEIVVTSVSYSIDTEYDD